MQNPPSNAHARAHIGNCMMNILPDPQIFFHYIACPKVSDGRSPRGQADDSLDLFSERFCPARPDEVQKFV
ncbi:MAG: hypothetical protein C6P37_09900 [Caldibacillus debilis]|uniref:Uncharacterized protein n=1 Tax=Caldibacillus debilis TaxID=301148 RepID=A0A3E0K483_9BACI|nr:MAG: hypothetical protein C6P37_09900 [Caldibacillus debilis]